MNRESPNGKDRGERGGKAMKAVNEKNEPVGLYSSTGLFYLLMLDMMLDMMYQLGKKSY